MKKYLFTALVVTAGLCFISWGNVGHQVVAEIAQNHLTPEAQTGVKNLLGRESMADVSSWADDIRSEPQNKYTAHWHFIDIELGLTFEQFSTKVKTMKDDNAYKAILYYVNQLRKTENSKTKKTEALKYLVHFVGDLHQPMHVSRTEDRGGNNVSVTFFGRNENLHGLWDYGMIDHEGLAYKKMAVDYDSATPEQIKKWQSDNVMIWAWESYQISTILYQEAADNPQFGEEYYKDHIDVIRNRIEKGGIRLAGLLNMIFGKPAQ